MVIPWTAVVIFAVIFVLAIAIVLAVVIWQRKRARAAPQPTGPSVSDRLRGLWLPFYRNLPARALHFPTVVVMGEAGVGKTHLISCHVDWRGQTNQFRPSVDQGAALQLYLGPEVVVHELSAVVLRDVSRDMKRALRSLWTNMGPSATVVLALDARTLLSTHPAALREFAQLALGKISLFPAHCRDAVDVRIYLSHLDRIEGYPEFAAAIGADHGALELNTTGQGQPDADRLVATFDAHLAHALTRRTGEEFDRLVCFYEALPKLIHGLSSVLEALRGKDEAFADRHPASSLYLGSLVPYSHVGDPFAIDRTLIGGSVGRQRRRGLRGSLALAGGLSVAEALLMIWHAGRIDAAEQAIVRFERVQDHTDDVNEEETDAAADVVAAENAMHASEILWLDWAYGPQKTHVDEHFETAIRKAYLEPKLSKTDRIQLLFVTALIYAADDNALSEHILANSAMWADELGLTEWVIEAYVQSSREPYDKPLALPDENTLTGGREWSDYLVDLDGMLRDTTLSPEEVTRLSTTLPRLRSREHYAVLDELLRILKNDPKLSGRLGPLWTGDLDRWEGENYAGIASLRAAIAELELEPGETKDWGLAQLVRELQLPSPSSTHPYTIKIDEFSLDSTKFDAAVERTRRHELIDAVLDRMGRSRPGGGREFFGSTTYANVGVIRGFGEGSQSKISGFYTKAAFEGEVAPVLHFAGKQLAVEPGPAADTIALTTEDRQRLDRAIRAATGSYAAAYHQELSGYYHSFEFDPGSDLALPFAIKAFAQPVSWFTEFLLAVSRNAALELPEAKEGEYDYFEPMRLALGDFAPLVALLAEDAGLIPGLEPYQGLMAGLQKRVTDVVGETGDAEATDLVSRLSALGSLALSVAKGDGKEKDYRVLVEDWLFGAGLDPGWYGPFLAPAEAVHQRGLLDIRTTVATAWLYDVRPLATPLLVKYPFDPNASEDASIEEIETIVRKQGEPGTFWDSFDRLIRPAMKASEWAMVPGVVPPGGMLAMSADLDRMAELLWNDKGDRVPLDVVFTIKALPPELHNGEVASMVVVSAGGASVSGFNQRPEPQTLKLPWWEQGDSAVVLKMTAPQSNGRDGSRYRLNANGTFSFFRLLDLGISRDFGKQVTLTEAAISRGTRCNRPPVGTRNMHMGWAVALNSAGNKTRTVNVVLDSDPWKPFAIRDCR